MTVGLNIFQDKTTMPSGEATEIGTPVRVHQYTDSPKGAQVTQRTAPQGMNVESCCRPRRGHDY